MPTRITDPAERARIRRACDLQAQLYQYHAVMHGACEHCGCLIWAQVTGGFRCLHCAPPLNFPENIRHLIEATLPPPPERTSDDLPHSERLPAALRHPALLER